MLQVQHGRPDGILDSLRSMLDFAILSLPAVWKTLHAAPVQSFGRRFACSVCSNLELKIFSQIPLPDLPFQAIEIPVKGTLIFVGVSSQQTVLIQQCTAVSS